MQQLCVLVCPFYTLATGSTNGASCNLLAAEAKVQDDKMAISLNASGFYFTTK